MTKQVLIVEDDADAATSVAEVLESEGYRTALAAHGLEALESLRNGNRPDLILLDMMMPVMDGGRFREEQRRLPKVADIPVVTMTADGDARRKAASIEAAGYVRKPLSIDGLLEVVGRVCGSPDD